MRVQILYEANLLPVARVLHSLFGGDVHVRRERLVHKSPKAHAEVAGGAVHGLGQAFAQCPQAEEVIVHGVGEVHEVVEIHRVVLYLTHLHCEAFGIIWKTEISFLIVLLYVTGMGLFSYISARNRKLF